MHGWICETLTGVDGLRWGTLPDPMPGPGQVRVRVRAASLNFPDLLTVEGKYQIKPPLPFIPGAEFSGVVDGVGPDVDRIRVGDRVSVIGSHGGFGTHALASAHHCMPIPTAMPFEEAAAWAFTYGTNHHALIDRGALKSGEWVVITGAAGGIGSSAIQLAKAAGARVIALVSTPEKAAFCTQLGADVALLSGDADLREALRHHTDGKGVDVVLDAVGGALAEPLFRSMAWRGRYLVIGFAAGSIPALPWNLALLKGASIVGVFWGDFVRREPAAFAASLRSLQQWYAEGKLKPPLHACWDLTDLPKAYAEMAGRTVMGKIVLRPSQDEFTPP